MFRCTASLNKEKKKPDIIFKLTLFRYFTFRCHSFIPLFAYAARCRHFYYIFSPSFRSFWRFLQLFSHSFLYFGFGLFQFYPFCFPVSSFFLPFPPFAPSHLFPLSCLRPASLRLGVKSIQYREGLFPRLSTLPFPSASSTCSPALTCVFSALLPPALHSPMSSLPLYTRVSIIVV